MPDAGDTDEGARLEPVRRVDRFQRARVTLVVLIVLGALALLVWAAIF